MFLDQVRCFHLSLVQHLLWRYNSRPAQCEDALAIPIGNKSQQGNKTDCVVYVFQVASLRHEVVHQLCPTRSFRKKYFWVAFRLKSSSGYPCAFCFAFASRRARNSRGGMNFVLRNCTGRVLLTTWKPINRFTAIQIPKLETAQCYYVYIGVVRQNTGHCVLVTSKRGANSSALQPIFDAISHRFDEEPFFSLCRIFCLWETHIKQICENKVQTPQALFPIPITA